MIHTIVQSLVTVPARSVTPSLAPVLVVGASQAGLQLVTSLREHGHRGAITLVGAENRPPYGRPPLSKDFLAGASPEVGLALRGPGFYADRDIELVCGERIETVEWAAGEPAGRAVGRSGREFAFERLALTVGGSPRRLTVPGEDLAGIHYLRDLDDAARLRDGLIAARRVVIVGGGFIGLEIAAAARSAGAQVTILEATERLLGRVVSRETSDFHASVHRRQGSVIEFRAGARRFEGFRGQVTGVTLADGRTIAGDMVIVGIGLVPHTELGEQLGLDCDGGIIVDDAGRTSRAGIVAAGDCTTTDRDGVHVRVESVQNAIAQAKRAAATLIGVPPPAVGVPWFWSDQHDIKLQIAGLSAGYDATVRRGDPADGAFSILYYRSGRLIAIDAINAPRDYMAVRRVLESGSSVPPEAAGDPGIPLKSFIASAPDHLPGTPAP